jgi:predicted MFS family arabinose efflux permease
MALLTASVEPHHRGGFMSINSSVQQISMGLAAWLSGEIIQDSGERMARFGWIGLISVCFGLAAIYLVRYLRTIADSTATHGLVET